ncbi:MULTISPECIES: acetyltransferase [unclassified Rhizobium]|uniref:acetyltransferase n=1 Tax=unclassified Rhizobium TaxID=2613769 RepID=UPI000DBA4FA3|nr:acetyltransferase [Rhizobium sp. AN80A]
MFQAFDSRGKQPLGPEEFSMVQGLVKDYCSERSLELACAEAQEAARELLGWFQLGVTDRNRLRELLTSRKTDTAS